jgi:hypothetical protein
MKEKEYRTWIKLLKEYLKESKTFCWKALVKLDGFPKSLESLKNSDFKNMDNDLKMEAYRLAIQSKNIKAYAIAWLYRLDKKDGLERKKAELIIDELQKMLDKEMDYRYINIDVKNNYRETCAWVNFCFNNESKAYQIVNNLKDESLKNLFRKNEKWLDEYDRLNKTKLFQN